ncbi:MAG: hypothetical protein PHG27_00915 [Massilibacteroides sp.]|nr:hypothetical protein [Massilibacteroides sp.]MDD3062717.1 hypothetical protein [Massilibacteroides sp.]MDD4114147.1 hypothetical protein [Massilibacteroides sp.]MDD4660480.1 hypothetical protein [Massilibacteroides sp.]
MPPLIFAVNKEAPRATSLSYSSPELAIDDEYATSPYFLSLDGKWKFRWVPKVADIPDGFYREDYDISQWSGRIEFMGRQSVSQVPIPRQKYSYSYTIELIE